MGPANPRRQPADAARPLFPRDSSMAPHSHSPSNALSRLVRRLFPRRRLDRPAAPRGRQLRLEALEGRLAPAVFNVNAGDVSNLGIGTRGGLVWAINQANGNGQNNTIQLAAGSTYDLTAVNNYWYGPDGLPAIS